jgi:pimeloyl-ACP methyl ester carboxylesterase
LLLFRAEGKEEMKNPRTYGKEPFTVAVIHGGPGAAGQMQLVAKELSKRYGILEPLQTATSIDGQLHELHLILEKYGTSPLTLIGHSWGAWLVYLYASQYPASVKKIIMIGSGPFEHRYVSQILDTRLRRLNEQEKKQWNTLINDLNTPQIHDKNKPFSLLGTLALKIDSYHPLDSPIPKVEYRYDIYQKVWAEAERARRNGTLLKQGKQIRCRVVAIHGEYDPHPFLGVKEPLTAVIRWFKFILLTQCGHYPWIEKEAQHDFYKIINDELC